MLLQNSITKLKNSKNKLNNLLRKNNKTIPEILVIKNKILDISSKDIVTICIKIDSTKGKNIPFSFGIRIAQYEINIQKRKFICLFKR